MNKILEQIQHIGIVPVVVLEHLEDAKPLAKALCEGGLPCAEVTYRTASAHDAIESMLEDYPDMCVGAGTVLTIEHVNSAILAGAKYIVSPGLNPKIVKYCIARDIPVIPGVATPSEVEQAMELGLEVVKFFPAEAAGGIKMIDAMSAPYPNMRFMPTGGISPANMNEYLSNPKVIACGGSWMVKSNLLEDKKFDEIKLLVKQAVETMTR